MSTSAANSADPAGARAPSSVAAAYAATIVFLWSEAVIRIWFSKGGDAVLRLWAARAGDIAAMWLAMSVIGLAAWAAFAFAWRGRASVGTRAAWTVALVVSALLAPMIGEWGQAIGI